MRRNSLDGMRQKDGVVPRDVAVQGTLIKQNGDQCEPRYGHPTDEQPEVVSWILTALKLKEQIEK
jgi:hypothetical protein